MNVTLTRWSLAKPFALLHDGQLVFAGRTRRSALRFAHFNNCFIIADVTSVTKVSK